MALTQCTVAVENIQDLSDTPNATEGLTADQLKAKYDLTGKDLKTFINDTLIDELDSLFAVTTKGCLLSNTTNQAITTATGTNLSFDTEVYDTDGFHSPSVNPSRITIPAGVSKIKLHFN